MRALIARHLVVDTATWAERSLVLSLSSLLMLLMSPVLVFVGYLGNPQTGDPALPVWGWELFRWAAFGYIAAVPALAMAAMVIGLRVLAVPQRRGVPVWPAFVGFTVGLVTLCAFALLGTGVFYAL